MNLASKSKSFRFKGVDGVQGQGTGSIPDTGKMEMA